MFPLLKYTAEQVDDYFAKVTPEMVEASLAKDRHDWFDLLNLISPAAYPFMDAMRKKARLAPRRNRRGNASQQRRRNVAGQGTLTHSVSLSLCASVIKKIERKEK